MFGLPYIIAPMEAEAQCAYMEMLNLVDGVVTDDSDVFLFGARNVYKNIFDDRKYVETYFMKVCSSSPGLNMLWDLFLFITIATVYSVVFICPLSLASLHLFLDWNMQFGILPG